MNFCLSYRQDGGYTRRVLTQLLIGYNAYMDRYVLRVAILLAVFLLCVTLYLLGDFASIHSQERRSKLT